jgi:phospholipase/carboxylesterase
MMEMDETGILSGPSLDPAAGGAAQKLVILLHGVGSDGTDMISLAPALAEAVPHAAFLAPNAPFPFEMAPMGYQWFDIQTQDGAERLAQLRHTVGIVDAFIDDALAGRGLSDGDLVLGGFSQGAMIALFTALRRATPCAGVLGFSGRLEAPQTLADEIQSRPPVLLIHGEDDDRLPVGLMDEAVRTLRENHVPVSDHRCAGLGHGIDHDGVMLGAAFLRQSLPDADG